MYFYGGSDDIVSANVAYLLLIRYVSACKKGHRCDAASSLPWPLSSELLCSTPVTFFAPTLQFFFFLQTVFAAERKQCCFFFFPAFHVFFFLNSFSLYAAKVSLPSSSLINPALLFYIVGTSSSDNQRTYVYA